MWYSFPAASCPPPGTGGRESTVPEGPQKSEPRGSAGAAVSATVVATDMVIVVLTLSPRGAANFWAGKDVACGISEAAEIPLNLGAF